ncbi:hypothetical protein [Vibrio metschnikovii]|uniref:hypothetical protein n=1 Tax=Vibrio metschnikovii TaxID=28172 RepID=UPI001C2FC632|nr:hypothetical protein [Vibrio metschnikovii]
MIFKLLLVVFVATLSFSVLATDVYEVKLFINPETTLDQEGRPSNAVWQAFGFNSNKVNDHVVLYMDTDALNLRQEGWSIRIRKRDTQGSHRIQYKKRYSITNGNVAAAKSQAESDGFNLNDADWSIETDWGFTQQTFSVAVTEKQKFKNISASLGMPNLVEAIHQSKRNAPDEFKFWSATNWGSLVLDQSRIYGEVTFTRFNDGSITYNNIAIADISLEIWRILAEQGDDHEYLIEVSFRARGLQQADLQRTALMEFLLAQNWLISDDVLKTQRILERY